MARRPDAKEDVLTKGQIAELHRNLSMLSPSGVLDFYRRTYLDCAPEKRPSAKAIQSLVTAWKILRRSKWRGTAALDFPCPRAIQQLVTAWKVLRRWRKGR